MIYSSSLNAFRKSTAKSVLYCYNNIDDTVAVYS